VSSKKWILVGVAILVTVIMLVTACPAEGPAEKGPVKIGFIGPYSGPVGETGQQMLKNFQLAVDVINENGGILGGRMVEALMYDDALNPAEAGAMARKAVTVDKVVAMCGTYEPGCGVAVRDVCREYNIPYVQWSTGLRNYVDGYYHGHIMLGISPAGENYPVYQMVEEMGLKTVTIVIEEMDWSRQLAELYHMRWDAPGSPVEIVEEIWHTMGKADLKSEYTKAVAANPDFIVLCEWSPPALQASINATHELGFEGLRFGFGPLSDMCMLAQFGEEANSIILPAVFIPCPGVPSNDAYIELYEQEVGGCITDVGAMAYDAANIICLSIDKAGTDSDLEKIADAMHSLDYHLVAGNCPLELTEWGRVKRAGYYMATIQNGTPVDVEYVLYEVDTTLDDMELYTPEQ